MNFGTVNMRRLAIFVFRMFDATLQSLPKGSRSLTYPAIDHELRAKADFCVKCQPQK